jgi:hypothetical protein
MEYIHSRSFEKQGEALIRVDQKSEQVSQKHREEIRAGQSKHREELRAGQSKHREELKALTDHFEGGLRVYSFDPYW